MGTPLSNYRTICHVIYNSYLEEYPWVIAWLYSTIQLFHKYANNNYWQHIIQGLGGYFQDPGFDQNTVWDSGKLKIPWGERVWLLLGKRDTPEFGHRMWEFLACLSGIRDIVHSNSWCKTTRRAYSSVYYQSKLFKQSSNQQISRQKIKTHCLNWMPGKCTWYLKSRINSKYQLKGPSYIFL